MTRFKKCDMGDCDRIATKKVRLYLPIEEEHFGQVHMLGVKDLIRV
jgi:hypothetical protein